MFDLADVLRCRRERLDDGVRLRRAGEVVPPAPLRRAFRQPDVPTAWAAATATTSACGSALPMSSEARMIIRRAMKRVLARLEHRGQVVDGRVGVRAAHRLDERGRSRSGRRRPCRRSAGACARRPRRGVALTGSFSARAVWPRASRTSRARCASPPALRATSTAERRRSPSVRARALRPPRARSAGATSSGESGSELVELHPGEQRRVDLEVGVLGRRRSASRALPRRPAAARPAAPC